MSKNQSVALAGAVLMLIGTMLPFAKVLIFSVSMSDGDDGPIVIGAAIVAGIAVFLRWHLVAIIVAALGALIAIADMVDAAGKHFQLGSGGYVITLGAGVVVVAAAIGWSDKRKAARAALAAAPPFGAPPAYAPPAAPPVVPPTEAPPAA